MRPARHLLPLSEEECLAHLAGAGVARVGLSAGSLPLVLPVNVWVDDGAVWFFTGDGTLARAAAANTVVCIEVDHVDRMDHTGWSVVATGRAELADDLPDRADLPLASWAGHDAHLVRVPIELVSGRLLE